MAGKIEIFKLDIDVDAAIDSQSELKTVLDATKASLDALAKSGDTSSKQYVELQAEVKRLNSEYNAAQTQLGKMLNLRGKEIKTVQEGEAALTILNKEWAKQAQLYGSNSKEADDLAKKHAELKERTRELRLGIGDTSTNVGNYTQSMKEAIGQSGLLQKVQTNYNQTLMISQTIFSSVKNEFNAVVNGYRQGKKEAEAMAGSQKLLAASTNYTNTALKLFKVALISTGIGAIVVLLGSLVAWFSKTQKGIDFVNKALAGLGAAFDVIIDRVAKIGGALIKFITGDFSGAFNDIKDAVTGVNQELVTEIALAYKLQEAMQKLEKQETLLDFRRAAANTRIKELNKLIEDTTKTTNERIKAAKEVERLETEIAAQELSNAQQALAHAQGKFSSDEKSLELLERLKNGTIEYDEVLKNLGLSESTKEDVDKFLAAFQKAEEAQQRSFEVRTTNQNKLNTLLNEEQRKREEAAKAAIDAAKRVADEAIKEQQAQLKLFIQQQGVRAKSLEEQLKMSQDVADREIAILDAQLKNRNITQTEYDAQYLAIKNELAKQQANASVENAQRELNEYITANQSKLDNEKYFSDESLRIEQERLNGLAQARRDFETTRLTEGVINQQQYNDAINAINEENRIALQDAQIARDETKKEAQAVDLANQMAIDEMNFKNQFDLESF
ncbi:MAG: hypothetical protein KDC62_08780, partial [Aequorivita sp.]|nr:hypothetical protein [Aequorivita sp.]